MAGYVKPTDFILTGSIWDDDNTLHFLGISNVDVYNILKSNCLNAVEDYEKVPEPINIYFNGVMDIEGKVITSGIVRWGFSTDLDKVILDIDPTIGFALDSDGSFTLD